MTPDQASAILAKLDGLKELFEDKFERNEKDHLEIIKHQKNTDGRVTRLEGAKNKFLGALIITEAIVIPLALIYLSNYI